MRAHWKISYVMPGTEEFRELIDGPSDEGRYHVDVLRRRWKTGGREAVAANWSEVGKRAWGWWRFDCPRRDLTWALGQATEAEALVALGYCDREEREAIFELGIIEDQLANDAPPTPAEIEAAKRIERKRGS
jgi:hypothetical protein